MASKEKLTPNEIKIHPSVFVANTASVVGDVTIGPYSSVWFGAVLRGDLAAITIGEATNIQDNAVIHVDSGQPTKIGDRVTIGHGAIVHGSTVGDEVLIGMGALVLSGATISSQCIVAAGAVVTEGMHVPARSFLVGIPARVVRELRDEEMERILYGSRSYVERATNYMRGVHK